MKTYSRKGIAAIKQDKLPTFQSEENERNPSIRSNNTIEPLSESISQRSMEPHQQQQAPTQKIPKRKEKMRPKKQMNSNGNDDSFHEVYIPPAPVFKNSSPTLIGGVSKATESQVFKLASSPGSEKFKQALSLRDDKFVVCFIHCE